MSIMNTHYIPQFYLKGFQTKEGNECVVRYERGSGRSKVLPIKAVANENDLYPPEIERFLNERYEKPANTVLRKLREFETISFESRVVLVEYFLVMRERAPWKKDQAYENVVKVIPERLREIELEKEAAIAAHPSKRQTIESNFERINAYMNSGTDLSKNIWLGMLQNLDLPRIFNALLAMNWCLVVSRIKDSFITCDAPFFFTSGIGLNKPNSEVLIPISSRLSLWLNWYPVKREIIEARQSIVNEANKRQVSNAKKYVFYSNQYDWLSAYCKMKTLDLRTLELGSLMRKANNIHAKAKQT